MRFCFILAGLMTPPPLQSSPDSVKQTKPPQGWPHCSHSAVCLLQIRHPLTTICSDVLLNVPYGGQSVSSHTVSVQGSSMKSGPPILKFTWVFFIMTFLLNISFSNIGQNPAICSNLFYVSSGYLSSMFPQFSADIFLRCILESTISEYDKENDTS